jgi:PAS domain S-box-containing protein
MADNFTYSEISDPIAELVKINPVPSLLIEMEGLTVVVVNEATVKLLGYSKEELLGQPVTALVPAEDMAAVEHASEEPPPEGETNWRCLTKAGTILYLKLKYRETVYRGLRARFIVAMESSSSPLQ